MRIALLNLKCNIVKNNKKENIKKKEKSQVKALTGFSEDYFQNHY